MKHLINDIIGFVSSLSSIDILLYFAVVILIVLVVSLIYIIKTSDEEEEMLAVAPKKFPPISNNEELNLQEVMEDIENNGDAAIIGATSYEMEQEEKAIISYEELLKKSKYGTIDYDEKETKNEDVVIKKINLESLAKPKLKEEKKETSHLFQYEKEEAFLKALQQLNELLN